MFYISNENIEMYNRVICNEIKIILYQLNNLKARYLFKFC